MQRRLFLRIFGWGSLAVLAGWAASRFGSRKPVVSAKEQKMNFNLPKIEITVIRRGLDEALIQTYLEKELAKKMVPCTVFSVGQRFEVEDVSRVPDNFCSWAWADIRHVLASAQSGGTTIGFKQPAVHVAGCSDWFRPVLFEIKRLS